MPQRTLEILLLSESNPSDMKVVLSGIVAQRESINWNIRMIYAPKGRDRLRALLAQTRPDGCVVHCGLHGNKYREEDFGATPVVWMDRDPATLGPNALCVVQDSRAAGRLAAKELLRQRDLASFAFVDRPDPQFWSAERRDAFRDEVVAAGCEYRYFADATPSWYGRRLEAFLAALPKPSGVFCANDATAGAAMDAARRAGIRMPDEMAIVGVDDTDIYCDLLSPTLTSVRPAFATGGREAARLLARRIADPSVPGEIRTFEATEIARRQSTRRVEIRGAMVTKALEVIRKGAAAGIGVDDVAAVMGCSRRSAEMLFRKWLGSTIIGDIHAERVAIAKRLLEEGRVPLQDVPARCGFRSFATFRRVFKSVAGIPPGRYARRGAAARGHVGTDNAILV